MSPVLQRAIQHHQAGRLSEAEAGYREILEHEPLHADALHLLGVLALQVGQLEAAADLIGRAIAVCPTAAEYHSNLGTVLTQQNRFGEASDSYERAIELKPDYADAYYNLGLARLRNDEPAEAATAFRTASALRPNSAEVYNDLGNALRKMGQETEATDAYEMAIRLRPDFAQAHHNRAVILQERKEWEKAVAAYQQALHFQPNYPEASGQLSDLLLQQGRSGEAVQVCREAVQCRREDPGVHYQLARALQSHGELEAAIEALREALRLNPNCAPWFNDLGNALREQRRMTDAMDAYQSAIRIDPNFADTYNNLGAVLGAQGNLEAAIENYRTVIRLKPEQTAAHYNLGNALRRLGRWNDAKASYRAALQWDPKDVDVLINLGAILHKQGQSEEAIAIFRNVLEIQPANAIAYNNLGHALQSHGQTEEAIQCYRRAMAIDPQEASFHSNFVFALHCHPDYDAKALFEEHRRWNQQHAEPLKALIRPCLNDCDPKRRLRIGYVSPDLRNHPVGRFLLPLFEHHDHDEFEVFAYSNVAEPDSVTDDLRAQTDQWQCILSRSDADVAELVRQDRIDILIDLAAHSADNRLLVFARKPAPIQVTYLAYCSTTGLDTIDYRMSDPYLDGGTANDSCYSETTICLPETYWCYRPSKDAPEVRPLPALVTGQVTFGCLNNFAKVSPLALKTWSKLLRAVPNSRLILHAHEGSHRQRVVDQFALNGIDPRQLSFVSQQPMAKYFALYHEIDIAMDTFPYAGGTTTCDALWMGVPVVSLAGDTGVSRGGLSILSNAGYPEWVTHSEADYIQVAAELANDQLRLSELRAALRSKMKGSPLMDERRFTRNIEAAFRMMWQHWCGRESHRLY